MSLYPLLIVAVVLLSREGARDSVLEVVGPMTTPWWMVLGLVVLPYAILLSYAGVAHGLLIRKARNEGDANALGRAWRVDRWIRHLILVQHAASVWVLGLHDHVCHAIGDLILVDEVIVIAVPVAACMVLSALRYSVERVRLDATTIRRLDQAAHVEAMPGRGDFVLMELRMKMLPMLLPLLAILGSSEAIDLVAFETFLPWAWSGVAPDITKSAMALLIFALSPLVLRSVLHVSSLAEGPTRTLLLDVCRAHGVRVRDVLVWHTNGSVINAAVTGLIAPLRFVMLSDALLQTMSRDQLVAVMAHEVAHVRRRHMPWMLAALVALIVSASALVAGAWWGVESLLTDAPTSDAFGLWGSMILAAVIVLTGFGWVSRRFERQADTFAVEHLSAHPVETAPRLRLDLDRGVIDIDLTQPSETITPKAVESMTSALECIARRHLIRHDRKDWRHGSIGSRQRYLQSLHGATITEPFVHMTVRLIKLASLLVLLGFLVWMIVAWNAENAAMHWDIV